MFRGRTQPFRAAQAGLKRKAALVVGDSQVTGQQAGCLQALRAVAAFQARSLLRAAGVADLTTFVAQDVAFRQAVIRKQIVVDLFTFQKIPRDAHGVFQEGRIGIKRLYQATPRLIQRRHRTTRHARRRSAIHAFCYSNPRRGW